MRIAIAGVPRSGKSTYGLQLAQATKYPLTHADDFIAMGWSEASAEVARRLVTPGPYVIEGVAVMRALRKALEYGPGMPCDRLHWFGEPRQAFTKGQASMAAADTKRFAELRPELEQRGVVIVLGAGAVVAAPAQKPAPPPVATKPAAAERPATQPYDAGPSRWSGSPGRGFG